jgi:transmembrane sensor
MNPINRDLLRRYLSGDVTPEESERIEAWLAEDTDRWEQVAALRDEMGEAALSESAVDGAKAEVWARLRSHIPGLRNVGERAGRRRTPGHGREFAPSSGRLWFTGAQLAAALLLTVLGGTALGGLMYRWRSPVPAETMRLATTSRGQSAVFRLADDTRVVLGAASTLRYPSALGAGSRQVSLTGEAYFEVVHDERRPFEVRAGDLIARDLGTEFTVRAYHEDAGARVVVRRGRVAIRAAARESSAPERIVAAGQLGRLGSGVEPTVESADTATLFAWTEGRLVFANTPLREAVRQIERARDVEIRLSPPEIGEQQFTTSFSNEPTSDILKVIGTGLRLDVVQTGTKTFTLHASR